MFSFANIWTSRKIATHAIGALLAVLVCGQALALDIPGGHPRLWFGNAERLAAARTFYGSNPIAANNTLSGSNARNRALRALMSRDTAECDVAVQWAMRFDLEAADENGDGRADPGSCNLASEGRTCDRARWEGENAMLVYDWCHASFTPEQRGVFTERWNRYLGALNEGPFNWQLMPPNNYNWGYLRNGLLWGIASHGENPRAQEFIDHALTDRYAESFVPWTQTFGVGGVPGEGSQYGAYPIEYSAIALWTARDFGYDGFAATPFWEHASYYLAYATSPGITQGNGGPRLEVFPFNDDHNFINGGSAEKPSYANLMGLMVMLDPDSDRARHARAWLRRTGIQPDWWIRAALAGDHGALDAADLPLDYFAEGYKFLYTRDEWSDRATSVLLELGALGSQTRGGLQHDGREAGSFQLWRRGRWMSRESVGYRGSNFVRGWNNGPATSAEHPIAHNTVLFNGNGQIGAFHAQPRMLRLQHAPRFAYAAVDLRGAYRSHATIVPDNQCWLARDDWPYADAVVREAVFLREWSVLLVIDRLRASDDSLMPRYTSPCNGTVAGHAPIGAQDVQKTFVMHFPAPPQITGRRVTATDGDQAIDAHLLLPTASQPRLVDETSCDRCGHGQFRMEVDDGGAADTYFVHAIHARDANAAPIAASFTANEGTWHIALQRADGRRVSLYFAAGTEVGAASIRFDDGAAEPLHGGVQRMRILWQGPAWEALAANTLFSDGFE